MTNLVAETIKVEPMNKIKSIKIATMVLRLQQQKVDRIECPQIDSDKFRPINCVYIYRLFPGEVPGDKRFARYFARVCCQYPSVCDGSKLRSS